MHIAFGLVTPKAMHQHYDQQQTGTQQAVSPDLQRLFGHSTENEINAVATLVSKIYPELIYFEDVCAILSLTHGYGVISGDHSGKIWLVNHKFRLKPSAWCQE